MPKAVRLSAVFFAVVLLGGFAYGQTAELLIWRLPTPDALPSGVAVTASGKVYIAEFSAQKIGLLDPAANELAERDIGGNPASIHAPTETDVVYTLPLEDAIEYLVFASGNARWRVPTPGSWPQDLTPAPHGPGQINLWFAERTGGKVGLLAPPRIAVTLPLISPARTTITPERLEPTPDIVPVTPTLHPGNPLLPPPIALVQRNANGPITEWEVLGAAGGTYVEDVALSPAGAVWFATGDGSLGKLDPDGNTVLFYSLPAGVEALGVTVDRDGTVWFTDTGTPAIGSLDPNNGDVTLWPIPGGVQPLDLLVETTGHVWFIDREGDTIGFLRPDANEFTLYRLPPGSYPVDLARAVDGSMWFVCERGNYVARLAVIPVVAPPATPGAGAARILGYSVAQRGNRATIQVIYSYDGSLGLPVYIGLYVLPSGHGFAYGPYRIEHPGTGTGTIELTYTGSEPVTTEGLRLVIYLPSGQVIAEREVELRATWTP